jgi:hypothetical protein
MSYITILGSCRQQSIIKYLNISLIQEELNYPHYTKEILQQIIYLKNKNISNDQSKFCFRSGLLDKCNIEITDEKYNSLKNEFDKTDFFLLEISSRKGYKWNNLYLHHIAENPEYCFHDIENIIKYELSDEEIEEDIINIQKELYPKKIFIISHFSTYSYGKRFELIRLLEKICLKRNIPFLDQTEIIKKYGPTILENEPVLVHYKKSYEYLVGEFLYNKIMEIIPIALPSISESAIVINNSYNNSLLIKNNIFTINAPIKKYTIVYTTYDHDLEWLKCSLLSLKKFLFAENILELIIYTHDISYPDVLNLLEDIQIKYFIRYRVIPMAYNYHGYIKQMVAKANCYKDVQTEYVILLDSDLILQRNLNFESLINKDGKIDWFYLKKEDDPENSAFIIWRKVSEDMNKIIKKIHYSNDKTPLIFTRTSLEKAAYKFIELHNCNYDLYCYDRCCAEKINVEDLIQNIFYKLNNIFSLFEYLGFFCNCYLSDYTFKEINYLDKDLNINQNIDVHSESVYFIQEKLSLKEIYIRELLDKNNSNRIFTIVYKTYKNDLEWLKYSLLSLKKFLDPFNIYEIIIYTHDIAYLEVLQLLENIKLNNFISYRIFPIAYNYHGYIKQMVVKANCYIDVQTQYVILLDSDLILQKYLDVKSLIRENGKIEWKYLRIEDAPNNPVFKVWKKACEDSNKIPKNTHYMSNGFPFIFTRDSLEKAAHRFNEVHGCNYDTYCNKRCNDENIRVEESTNSIFNKLSTVFTEFEYLGFFCHYYSLDYIFTTTPYCKIEFQDANKNNYDSYFIQYWSHGSISNEILNKINNILLK